MIGIRTPCLLGEIAGRDSGDDGGVKPFEVDAACDGIGDVGPPGGSVAVLDHSVQRERIDGRRNGLPVVPHPMVVLVRPVVCSVHVAVAKTVTGVVAF